MATAEKIACCVGCRVSVQFEMLTLVDPALKISMNESVKLTGGAELMRNSLILTGLTFRTFSAVVSDSFAPVVWLCQATCPTMSPLNALSPDVTLKVALTLAPGAIGPANVFE